MALARLRLEGQRIEDMRRLVAMRANAWKPREQRAQMRIGVQHLRLVGCRQAKAGKPCGREDILAICRDLPGCRVRRLWRRLPFHRHALFRLVTCPTPRPKHPVATQPLPDWLRLSEADVAACAGLPAAARAGLRRKEKVERTVWWTAAGSPASGERGAAHDDASSAIGMGKGCATWQAAQCPGATSRSAGRSVRQRAKAIGQRV
jgi:hypothetical protein